MEDMINMRKVALPVALCGVGAGIALAAPHSATDDALTAMVIVIAVSIVLTVIGLFGLLILRVNRERSKMLTREIPPVKVIRVSAERIDIPRAGIAEARSHLGERGTV